MEVFGERAVFYILCLMLVFAPLAFGAVRPWSRNPMLLLTLVALLCWGARVVVAGRISWVRAPLDLPIAVGILYVVARYATSPVEWESRQEMLLVLMYAAVYFLATQHLVRRQRLNILLWLLVGVAIGICAYAIINRIRGVEMVWWLPNKDYSGRSFGTFYCPNHFSGYLELVLAVAGAHLLWSGRAAAQRIVLAYGVAVMLGGIAISLSRGGYLSTGAMLLALAFAVSRGVSKQWWPGIALAVALAVGGGVAVSSFPSIRTRFESLTPTDSGMLRPNQPLQVGEASRWWMWVGAWKMFSDHPWFGVGPFLFNTCYGPYRVPEDQCEPEHVHNDYLQALSDYGVVGFVLMGVLIITFFVSAWRIHQRWRQLGRDDEPRWHWPFWLDLDRAGRPAWLLGSALAVVCYMVHSVVDFNLHISANALTLTVIMAAGMVADCSRRLTPSGGGEGVTLPPVVKFIELPPAAQKLVASVVVALVIGVGWVVVPNYGAYLLMRLAEKQYAVEKPVAATPAAAPAAAIPAQGLFGDQHAARLDAARAYAERAWRWDPRNYQVARLLGDISMAQARNSYKEGDALARQSIAWYEQAERLNPFPAALPTRRADALEFLGRWNDAEAARARAVALEPNCYLYHRYMGTFHLRRGKSDLALASFQRAHKLYGGDRFSAQKIQQLTAAAPPTSRPTAPRSDPAKVLRDLLAPSKTPPSKQDAAGFKRQLDLLDSVSRTNAPAPARRSDPSVVLRDLLAPLPSRSTAPASAPAPRSDPATVLRELLPSKPAPAPPAPASAPAPAAPPPAAPSQPIQAPVPLPSAAPAPPPPSNLVPAMRDLIAPIGAGNTQFKSIQTPLQKPLQQPIPPAGSEPPRPASREALIQQLDAIAAQPRTNAPASNLDTNKINRILAPFIRRR